MSPQQISSKQKKDCTQKPQVMYHGHGDYDRVQG